MTPERWQQIEKLYDAALNCEADRRAAWLDQACAGDDPLRREVEALLAAHEQAGSFMEAPAPGADIPGTGPTSNALLGGAEAWPLPD